MQLYNRIQETFYFDYILVRTTNGNMKENIVDTVATTVLLSFKCGIIASFATLQLQT